MTKVIVEIEMEESEFTTSLTFIHDVLDALSSFKDKNRAWSKIKSVSCGGLTATASQQEGGVICGLGSTSTE